MTLNDDCRNHVRAPPQGEYSRIEDFIDLYDAWHVIDCINTNGLLGMRDNFNRS